MTRTMLMAGVASLVLLGGASAAFANGNNHHNNNSNAHATGVGVGIAGAHASNNNRIGIHSANNNSVSSRNTNRNYVTGGSNRNYNTNNNQDHNYNRNSNYNQDYNSNSQGQHQGQGQQQGQSQGAYSGSYSGQEQAVNNEDYQGITINEGNYEVPTNAPALSALTGSACMGSSTISGAGGMFSLGLGTTWNDEQCQLRENIKLVYHLDPALAKAMLADLDGVQEAMVRLGAVQGTAAPSLASASRVEAALAPSQTFKR